MQFVVDDTFELKTNRVKAMLHGTIFNDDFSRKGFVVDLEYHSTFRATRIRSRTATDMLQGTIFSATLQTYSFSMVGCCAKNRR